MAQAKPRRRFVPAASSYGMYAKGDARGTTTDPTLHVGLIKKIAYGIHLALSHPMRQVDLEEIEAEVALFILEKRHLYDPAKPRFSTWLMYCRQTIYHRCRRKFWDQRRQSKGNRNWRGLPFARSIDSLRASRSGDAWRADTHHPPAPAPPEGLPADAQDLRRAMEALLTDREVFLLTRRAAGQTFESLLGTLGVCREGARQIEAKALLKLARALGATGRPISITRVTRRPRKPHSPKEST